MKRLIVALVPWMGIATAAYGQARPAEVSYTHFPPLEGKAFRVLDECFVPISSLSDWGWRARVRDGIAVIEAEGRELRMTVRTFSGVETIPLRSAVDQIGGESSWIGNGTRLEVLSRIRSVRIEGGRVAVEGTLTTKHVLSRLSDPPRLVVEIAGARLDRRAEQILGSGARVEQSKANSVRVVMVSDALSKPGDAETIHTRKFMFDGRSAPDQEPKIPVVQDPASAPVHLPLSVVPEMGVSVESSGSGDMMVRLASPLTSAIQVRKPEPNRIEIVLPNVRAVLADGLRPRPESVTSVAARFEDGSSVIQIDLSRAMAAEIIPTNSEVQIRFLSVPTGNGQLAGKIVVVDPGHGGSQSGARSGSTLEKNMTLAISKVLAQKLAAAGATVIMTRKTDVHVGLEERAEIANRNGADLFVSVHINSNAVANSTSGGITFYHKQDPGGKLLAECIQREIGKVSGLPSLGAWSDQRIYKSGFSVLRNSTMPGVLIEMGFINHARDRRRMLEPEFHQAVSSAIVRGIKVFLGDDQTQKEAK